MIYCLDSFGTDGISGKSGTSHMAMMFLANWLAGFGKTGHLPISARYITGEQVNFSQNGPIRDALCRNGAAVARVDLEGWHYVLLTGAEGTASSCSTPTIWRSSQSIRTSRSSRTRRFPTTGWSQRGILSAASGASTPSDLWRSGRPSSFSTSGRGLKRKIQWNISYEQKG